MHFAVRIATAADAHAVAELYIRARKAAEGSIPAMVHSDSETRGWIAQRIIPHSEVWVAESDTAVLLALLVLNQDWIDQLYVDPTLTGRGIGSDLIRLAKRERPDGLRLWTFESNLAAQRFYERHGFRVIARTAGENEEGAPDLLYAWGCQTLQ